ncbi:MAG: cryptochrome/photolyase family protein [Aureliella sp.]
MEDPLFFRDAVQQTRFHKQKIWLHRATMQRYQEWLLSEGYSVDYVDFCPTGTALTQRLTELTSETDGSSTLALADPVDYLLTRRLRRVAKTLGCQLDVLPTPCFLNSAEENTKYRQGKRRWFMADFYKWQRQRFDILMDGDQPCGGKWSFDEENRKKIPKSLLGATPALPTVERDSFDKEAIDYVNENFAEHPGELDELFYPTSHAQAADWLDQFLASRLERFGDYEDSIEQGESWLWHSVLTPMLNIGLLTPKQVIDRTVDYAADHGSPLNSVEGYIRQVIGWREFMRATYEDLGVQMRTTNHWSHTRKIPPSFYDATTGIVPIDDTISRILRTGYCHHIERLMVLGGFMFLCEFDPEDIYDWFMELFVDSYDWVMVPNVYAMSQNADGGLITTKPYFSGSSYVRKMSHYKAGQWCDTWDGLYWRWILKHSEQLGKNPRWAMMCSMAKRMDESKRSRHVASAEQYLASLG